MLKKRKLKPIGEAERGQSKVQEAKQPMVTVRDFEFGPLNEDPRIQLQHIDYGSSKHTFASGVDSAGGKAVRIQRGIGGSISTNPACQRQVCRACAGAPRASGGAARARR